MFLSLFVKARMSTPRSIKPFFLATLFVLLNVSFSFAALPVVDRQTTVPTCPLNNFCFVYDNSGSISSAELQLELDFIEAISLAISNVAPNVTYSAAAFTSSASLVQASTTDLNGTFLPALRSFSRLSGSTNIGSGMRLCLDEIVSNQGTRAMIVITDGQDGTSLAPTIAEEARNESVAVATIGVLPDIDRAYLEGLATLPEFYSEANFNELPTIIERVVNATCELATTFACQINDVCFAIDSSSSVNATEFAQQQNFVREIATIIDARNSSATFSAHTFADSVMPVAPIGTMDSLSSFIPRIDSLVLSRGSTNVFAGLKSCFEDLNNRTGNRAIVVVTDGRDNNSPRAIRGRQAVVDSGIGILTVGIGSMVNTRYLNRLTTVPGSVVTASSFSTLPSAVDMVTNEVCNMTSSTPTPPAPVSGCEAQFQGCLLRFRTSRTLQMFRLRGRGRRFTPVIVSKFGAQFPGRWRRVRSSMVNDDGSIMRLRNRPFHLSGRRSPYGVTLNVAKLSDAERLAGKCVRLDLDIRRGSGIISQCVVFRVSRP